MAALPTPARSAHTLPQTEKAARRAARQWFAGATRLSLASWRDDRCTAHCSGLPAAGERAEVFNQAFAKEMAFIISRGFGTDYQRSLEDAFQCPEGVSVERGRFVWEDGTEQRGYLVRCPGGHHE